MAEKRIANRRIYGIDPRHGRTVLVALPGHPLPEWYEETPMSSPPEPGKAPAGPGAGDEPKIEKIPKRSRSRSTARKRKS